MPSMTVEVDQARASGSSKSALFKALRHRLLQAITPLCLVGFLVLVAVLLAAAVPKAWGFDSWVIHSGSMEPTINEGSLVIGRPVDVIEIQEGDIINFPGPSSPSENVTHRVIGIRQEAGVRYFTTKGDANASAEPAELQLQGTVHRFSYELPYLGYFLDFAKSTCGVALLVALPMIALVLSIVKQQGDSRIESRGRF